MVMNSEKTAVKKWEGSTIGEPSGPKGELEPSGPIAVYAYD